MICESCKGYYKLQEGESPEDFDRCQCGGKLKYESKYVKFSLDEIEEVKENRYKQNRNRSKYYKKKSNRRESIVKGKTYTEKRVDQNKKNKRAKPKSNSGRYNAPNKFNLTLVSWALILGGAIFFFLYYNIFFLILIIIGLLLPNLMKTKKPSKKYKTKKGKPSRSNKSWEKGLKGENIVLNQLNTLPKGYNVFHDVVLPQKRGNIDHIVIGPTGLFVLETKNYSGEYRIDGKQWYYYKNGQYKLVEHDPGFQLIRNILHLKMFLKTKGIPQSEIYANAIVAFIKPNYTILRGPERYKVLTPNQIPRYIYNHKKQGNDEILSKIAKELEPYCTERTFVR